ncbi:CpsD/CapB family tyrosine-protein kinase [Seohaeicola saemankumensis]|uniref:CpsD/CapB family tyrosine-protein kinase n=1 Tax=Seohaeicola saemankumensis TaxID=481181 RepID=A0ABW3TE07_9RHOB
MKQYIARRRNTPRLDKNARDRILARIIDVAPPDAPLPAVVAQQAVAGRAVRGVNVPRIVDAWNDMAHISVNEALLDRNLVITASRNDPAHSAFEVLRTRLMMALAEKGWTRVAVTSPTDGCGKTFTAVNLAIALSRYDSCRTVLLDMDMRRPGDMARMLGAQAPGSMAEFLRGGRAVESHLLRMGQNLLKIGPNLAIGLNDRVESYASEILKHPDTTRVLERMTAELKPDVVLYDMPSVLSHDDLLAFRQHFDAVLLVSGGGITTADDLSEVMRQMGETIPLLGVVLNRGE